MDEMTLTLNNPLTEEEWDLIEDVDFDKTNSIEFHTKQGKTVKFVKCTDERTGDQISRQAAVDEFPEDALPWDTFDGYIAPHHVRKILKQLPSAQPDVPDINVGDTIYRSAAIEAVNEWLRLYAINRTMSNVTSIQDILRQLPSAQPEERTKEHTETHACDCISRQQAIDALTKDKKALEHIINGMSGYEKEFDLLVGQRNQVDYDINAIKDLPSAQPELEQNTHPEHGESDKLGVKMGETCTDAISRQAAIEYFVTNVGFHDEDGYSIDDSDELRKIWTEYFDGIPSTQPEIIQCKDCIYFDKYIDCKEMYQWDGFCADWARNTYENWYCSRAERREE